MLGCAWCPERATKTDKDLRPACDGHVAFGDGLCCRPTCRRPQAADGYMFAPDDGERKFPLCKEHRRGSVKAYNARHETPYVRTPAALRPVATSRLPEREARVVGHAPATVVLTEQEDASLSTTETLLNELAAEIKQLENVLVLDPTVDEVSRRSDEGIADVQTACDREMLATLARPLPALMPPDLFTTRSVKRAYEALRVVRFYGAAALAALRQAFEASARTDDLIRDDDQLADLTAAFDLVARLPPGIRAALYDAMQQHAEAEPPRANV